jgi:hypothetical protein
LILRFVSLFLAFFLGLSHSGFAQVNEVVISWDKQAVNPFTGKQQESFKKMTFCQPFIFQCLLMGVKQVRVIAI